MKQGASKRSLEGDVDIGIRRIYYAKEYHREARTLRQVTEQTYLEQVVRH